VYSREIYGSIDFLCIFAKQNYFLMTATTKLTPIQLHLLQMFNHIKNDSHLHDLKKILAAFYAEKVDEMSEKIWEEKGLSNDDMDSLLTSHLRKKIK
jgi:hypothetical protein